MQTKDKTNAPKKIVLLCDLIPLSEQLEEGTEYEIVLSDQLTAIFARPVPSALLDRSKPKNITPPPV